MQHCDDGRDSHDKGKLFVGGLSWDTTQDTLMRYFSKYGEVSECVVVKNPTTGKSRGFGFVTFRDPVCVETFLAAGPHIVDGKQIDPNGCNRKKSFKSGKGTDVGRRKLFVGGLPATIEESHLRDAFSKYGNILEVVIVFDQQKQRPRGFGFLTFESEDSVDRAVLERYVQIGSKQVECKRAEPKDMQLAYDPGARASPNMVLAQGADGALTLVPSAPAAHQVLYYQTPSGALISAADLAAYRANVSQEWMQPQGVRYVSPGPMMMSSGNPYSAAGAQYMLPNGQLVMPGGQMLQQAVQGPQYVLVGPGGGAAGLSMPHGMLAYPGLQQSHVAALQQSQVAALQQSQMAAIQQSQMAAIQQSQMAAIQQSQMAAYQQQSQVAAFQQSQMVALQQSQMAAQYQPVVGADLASAGYTSSAFGVQLSPTSYTYPRAEPATAVSALTPSENGVSEKCAAASGYPVISQYALGMLGGVDVQDDTRASDTTQTTAGTGATTATPRVGYYLVPNYQTPGQTPIQIQGAYVGGALASSAVPAGDAVAATYLQTAPQTVLHGRLPSSHPGLAQAYHPYRR